LFSLLMFQLWFETQREAAAPGAGQTRPAATFAA
jgi:hypothetical protein